MFYLLHPFTAEWKVQIPELINNTCIGFHNTVMTGLETNAIMKQAFYVTKL